MSESPKVKLSSEQLGLVTMQQKKFYQYIHEVHFTVLKGEILTLMDSVFTDQKQNKAVKDTVKKFLFLYTLSLEKAYEGNLEDLDEILSPGGAKSSEFKNILTTHPVPVADGEYS